MYKGRIGDKLMLGLSDENIKRLKEGQPIRFELAALGFDSPMVVFVEYTGASKSQAGRDGAKAIIGINDFEMEKLAADQVLHVPEHLARLLTRGTVASVDIFQGRTEAAIYDWLKAEGVITPQTIHIVDPRTGIG